MRAATRASLGRYSLIAYLVLFFAYLESPLFMIVLTSFNQGASVVFPPSGFSTQWYGALWNLMRDAPGIKPGLLAALWTSIWLGIVSMIGAVVAGVLAAVALQRHRFRGRELLRQCFLLPLLFPQVVTGIGLVLWFSAIGGVPAWVRLVIGHLILTLPYVVVSTTASLETLDARLEEAAMNLGATPVAAFWHITLPGIRSGVIAGAIFAWLTSFSNFTITYFLFSGEMQPLPPWLYEFIQYYVDPSVAALSTFVVLITLAMLLIVTRLAALGRLMGLRR